MDLNISNGLSNIVCKIIDKIGDATGFYFNRETPDKIAQKLFITEIEERIDIPALEKAALIANSKKIIKEYSNQINIVQTAIEHINEKANPDMVDEDWLSLFMDKARLVSKEDVQLVWGKLLADEFNCPNSVPKKLLLILEQMDRADAEDFVKICSFVVGIGENDPEYIPLILESEFKDYYNVKGLTLDSLNELESLGLIKRKLMLWDNAHAVNNDKGIMNCSYYDEIINIPKEIKMIGVGNTLFTKAGLALYKANSFERVDDFFEKICKPHFEKEISRRLKKSDDK